MNESIHQPWKEPYEILSKVLTSRAQPARPLPDSLLRPSAVCVLLAPIEGELSVLLTKRSMDVFHHKGQICFPGGMFEPEDDLLSVTALRETEEELGLPRSDVRLLGELDPQTTPTGFHITPFVGFVESSPSLQPNPSEIARVFWAPILALASTHAPDPWMPDFPNYEWDGERIWGATARMLDQLLSVCLR